ncbi:MAG: protoporphyrinogen oxidase [Acidimicrobiia bacterium]
MRVAVVGGGIAGLAAAHRLDRNGAEVLLYERDDRLGGKIRTSNFAGRAVDEGPDAFLARVPSAVNLCRELGLGDRLISPADVGALVYSRGKLRPIPDGLVLGVPAGIVGLATSGLLSPRGVARAALEPLLARRRYRGERDSVGAVIRHHFGADVLERVVDPLVGGIYAGNADTMSLAAGAPQLAGPARNRSMLFALRRQAKAVAPPKGAPKAPIFYAVRGGMGLLVDGLREQLSSTTVCTGVEVTAIARSGNSTVIETTAGPQKVDAVVLCTPAYVSATLLRDSSPSAARGLSYIAHASVAMITMSIDEGSLDASSIDGVRSASGFLIPRPERRFLTACSYASTKWPDWKPDGKVVLRVSAGASDQPGVCDLDDDTIVAKASEDLERLMGLRAGADQVRVTRWDRAFPQYEPGHLARADAIEAALTNDLPGVVLAGAAMRGVGVPACIRQGQEAATRILEAR